MAVGFLENFVRAVAPAPQAGGKPPTASVAMETMCLFTAPMLFMTDFENSTHARVTIMLMINIFVRLLYPTAYFPATASVPGLVGHPLTARCISFGAEFGLYEIWANWIGLDFWSNDHKLWMLVLVGELFSTIGTVLQMELLLVLEDTVWALHTSYMCYLAYPNPLPVIFFGGFGFCLTFLHMPRRYELLFTRGRSLNKNSSIFELNPLFGLHCGQGKPNHVIHRECKLEEKAWIVPMLLCQPVLTTLMYAALRP